MKKSFFMRALGAFVLIGALSGCAYPGYPYYGAYPYSYPYGYPNYATGYGYPAVVGGGGVIVGEGCCWGGGWHGGDWGGRGWHDGGGHDGGGGGWHH